MADQNISISAPPLFLFLHHQKSLGILLRFTRKKLGASEEELSSVFRSVQVKLSVVRELIHHPIDILTATLWLPSNFLVRITREISWWRQFSTFISKPFLHPEPQSFTHLPATMAAAAPASSTSPSKTGPPSVARTSTHRNLNLLNPLPLSASQEQEVRNIYYRRVRDHCAPEIRGRLILFYFISLQSFFSHSFCRQLARFQSTFWNSPSASWQPLLPRSPQFPTQVAP